MNSLLFFQILTYLCLFVLNSLNQKFSQVPIKILVVVSCLEACVTY